MAGRRRGSWTQPSALHWSPIGTNKWEGLAAFLTTSHGMLALRGLVWEMLLLVQFSYHLISRHCARHLGHSGECNGHGLSKDGG